MKRDRTVASGPTIEEGPLWRYPPRVSRKPGAIHSLAAGARGPPYVRCACGSSRRARDRLHGDGCHVEGKRGFRLEARAKGVRVAYTHYGDAGPGRPTPPLGRLRGEPSKKCERLAGKCGGSTMREPG